VLQQVAPPMELYRRPANQFVASFIGSPSMNFVHGVIARDGGRPRFTAAGGLGIDVPAGLDAPEGAAILGVRPHDIVLGPGRDGGPRGVVSLVEPLGSEQIVYVTVAGGADFVAAVGAEATPRVDDPVSVTIPPAAVHLFEADSGRRIGA
jgi:multiple sugar transport system ATP-binding protein